MAAQITVACLPIPHLLRPLVYFREGRCPKRAVGAAYFKTWKDRQLKLHQSGISWHTAPCQREQFLGTMPLNARSTVHIDNESKRTIAVHSQGQELLFETNDECDLQAWWYAIEFLIRKAKAEGTDSWPWGKHCAEFFERVQTSGARALN
jgi:hypothetical protein